MVSCSAQLTQPRIAAFRLYLQGLCLAVLSVLTPDLWVKLWFEVHLNRLRAVPVIEGGVSLTSDSVKTKKRTRMHTVY